MRVMTRTVSGFGMWHGEDMASVRSQISWIAVAEALALATSEPHGDAPLRVLDVGGGAGVDAVRVAREGHQVTVVDQSSDALAALQRRAFEANVDVVAIQADGEAVDSEMFTEPFDVVLCHGVLESAPNPTALLQAIVSALKHGGVLSVQVPSLNAAMKHHVSLGEESTALRLFNAEIGSWNLDEFGPRRYSWDEAGQLVTSAGLSLIGVRGVRVFGDSAQPDVTDGDNERFGTLLELEQRLRVRPEFAGGSGGLQALGRLD